MRVALSLFLLIVSIVQDKTFVSALSKVYPGDALLEEGLTDAVKENEEYFEYAKEKYNLHELLDEINDGQSEIFLVLERRPSILAEVAAQGVALYQMTIENILDKLNATKADISELFSPFGLRALGHLVNCKPPGDEADCTDMCFHSKYRTIDGTCNNLENPRWGASVTRFNRVKKSNYQDVLGTPKGWKVDDKYNGFALPSARRVSTVVATSKKEKADPKFTHMLMQWGQFLDHDITFTPVDSLGIGYRTFKPCTTNCEYDEPCFPITIPIDDPHIQNKTCFGFTRSSSSCEGMFDFDYSREQVNEVTSYIDASNVYGSSQAINDKLREHGTPFLAHGDQVDGHPGKYYLQFDHDGEISLCKLPGSNSDKVCFLAGDKRVTEQPGLVAMHTLWMREHNRVAKQLMDLNPHWDSEIVYQEARKIVGAQVQRITYEHYLPSILGWQGVERMGSYTGYKPEVDAGIFNSFATAAFRFGHGMIKSTFLRLDKNFNVIPEGNLSLIEAFFSPNRIIKEGGIDPLLRGMVYDSGKKPQPYNVLNNELREKLFKMNMTMGLDLAALSIQRGRDHGLPTYMQMREYCGFKSVDTFEELLDEIPSRKVLRRLWDVYRHPGNIDLWMGGLSEKPQRWARMGPVFLCLIVEQFRKLRDGDRFFYENQGVFTSDQLSEIKKTSLARIICDNSDAIDQLQPNVFRNFRDIHDLAFCNDYYKIPAMNLSLWRDAGCPGYPESIAFNTTFAGNQLCCCSKVYALPQRSPYKCCGQRLYDPSKDSCCDSVLYCGKPESVYFCCEKSVFNPAFDRCINGSVCPANQTRYCGELPYNSKTHICCEGNLCLKYRRTATCCGPDAYNPSRQICCRGSVRARRSRFTQCCRKYTYESDKEVCCTDTRSGFSPVIPRPKNLGDIAKYGMPMDKCNQYDDRPVDNSPFNYHKNSCCCRTKYNTPLEHDHNCCGQKPFDIWKQLCCDGAVVEGNPKEMTCCGKQAFNSSKQTCCNIDSGYVVVDCVGGCPMPDTGLCSGKKYELNKYLCCNGYLHEWPSRSHGCCGKDIFNRDTTTCCADLDCKLKTFLPGDWNGHCGFNTDPTALPEVPS